MNTFFTFLVYFGFIFTLNKYIYMKMCILPSSPLLLIIITTSQTSVFLLPPFFFLSARVRISSPLRISNLTLHLSKPVAPHRLSCPSFVPSAGTGR